MTAPLSPQQLAILEAVATIPPGRVSSYGQIAAIAGLPGRARLVGRTLGQAPDDRPVPWFRVLRAGGAIAFPEGSHGHVEQTRRLRREGVEVRRGRVDLARYGWRRTLDELLWAPPPEAREVKRAKSSDRAAARKSVANAKTASRGKARSGPTAARKPASKAKAKATSKTASKRATRAPAKESARAGTQSKVSNTSTARALGAR
jgi:methylated-DNA-protein-cysteine methyltransferase-like protein